MKSVLFISAMLFLSTYFYAKDSIKAVNGVAIDTIQIISTPLDTTKYNRTRIYTIYNFVNSDSTTILKDKVEDHTKIDITQDKTNTIKDIFNYVSPIITLIIGIFIEKNIESFSRKRRIKRMTQRWRAELLSIKEPLQKQIQVFDLFISKYGDMVYDIPKMQLYSDLKGDNLKYLDKSDLLEYLEMYHKEQESLKIYHKATGVISILENAYKNIVQKFQDFQTNSSNYIKDFNWGLQDFCENLSRLHMCQENPDKSVFTNTDWDYLMSLYNKYIVIHLEDSNFNPFILKEKFFEPTIEIISKHHSDESIIPISNSIRKCMNAVRGLRLEKMYIHKNLLEIKKWYLELLDTIDSISGQMNN